MYTLLKLQLLTDTKHRAASLQEQSYLFVNMHIKLLSLEDFFQHKIHQISFGSWAPPESSGNRGHPFSTPHPLAPIPPVTPPTAKS